mmetsp:Transcript_2638/g.7201  ORF Transcript_2638/g.7201 Transcript_2638/m.7201 type:complete len:243 (+) Transcript_2638:2764-3492(+)
MREADAAEEAEQRGDAVSAMRHEHSGAVRGGEDGERGEEWVNEVFVVGDLAEEQKVNARKVRGERVCVRGLGPVERLHIDGGGVGARGGLVARDVALDQWEHGVWQVGEHDGVRTERGARKPDDSRAAPHVDDRLSTQIELARVHALLNRLGEHHTAIPHRQPHVMRAALIEAQHHRRSVRAAHLQLVRLMEALLPTACGLLPSRHLRGPAVPFSSALGLSELCTPRVFSSCVWSAPDLRLF